MKASHKKKNDFIQILMSMTDVEINEYIKSHGKPTKPVNMCRIVESKNNLGGETNE